MRSPASWTQLRVEAPDSKHFSGQVLSAVLLQSIDEYVARDTTAQEYEIFVLRHFHELNLSEIPTVVDQPLTNVHRILSGLTGKIRRLYGSSTE